MCLKISPLTAVLANAMMSTLSVEDKTASKRIDQDKKMKLIKLIKSKSLKLHSPT